MNDSANTLAMDLERIEDNFDAMAARVASFGSIVPKSFPFSTVERICDGENPLWVRQEHRGLSQGELAAKSGLAPSILHAIEIGEMTDAPFSVALALSKALDIDIEPVMARPPAD